MPSMAKINKYEDSYKEWILHNIHKTQDEIEQFNTTDKKFKQLINRYMKLNNLLDTLSLEV